MNQADQPKKYFDLHLTGLGYLSRVREVNSVGHGRAKAKPFLACSISAFHGDPEVQNGIVYLNLDLIVSGEMARDAILSVMNDANDRDVKVLVGFRAGDHYISTYEIRQGDRAGQMGTVLKGRLLKVFWIKVDGVFVHREERQEDRPDDQSDDPTKPTIEDRHEWSSRQADDIAFDGRIVEPDASGAAASLTDDPSSAHEQDCFQGQQRTSRVAEEQRGTGFLRRTVRRTGTVD
jgi:hypothetical protein